MKKSKIFLSLLILNLCSYSLLAEFLAVSEKNPNATIIIGKSADDQEKKAAGILQAYIKKMSGTELPIKTDDEKIHGNIISIGISGFLPAELKNKLRVEERIDFLDPFKDSFIINAGSDRIYLAGHQSMGTVSAVYRFLEQLGCRWFFACDAGRIIPELSDIKIKPANIFEQPAFALRRQYSWSMHLYPAFVKEAENEWAYANMLNLQELPGMSGHNFSRIWPSSLYEAHPEYFPLQEQKSKEGKEFKRMNKGQRCLSNPGVIDLGIKWAEDVAKSHPEYNVITFAPNDSMGRGSYCKCKDCIALGNVADQNLYLGNQIAKEFLKKYPDKMINLWGYLDGAVIPSTRAEGYDKNQDRILVTLYSNFSLTPFEHLVEGWSKASHNIIAQQAWYWIDGRPGSSGAPVSCLNLTDQYSFYKQHNVKGIKIQTQADWAKVGFSRYAAARRMWDLNTDVEEIRKDFCTKMFPSASVEFYNYLAMYDEVSNNNLSPYMFLKNAIFFFDLIQEKITDKAEKERWNFYALYIYEQYLEYQLSGAQSDNEKIAILKKIISFLKGTEKRGIFGSSAWVAYVYSVRLKKLGVSSVDRFCPDILPMSILPESVPELFREVSEKIGKPRTVIMNLKEW